MSLTTMADESAPDAGVAEIGDVDAWLESVIREHYRGLYAYAHSLTRNAADAADLTQQVTVIFAKRWSDIKDRTKTKSWLFSCLYREFLRLKRKQKRIVSIEDQHEPETLATPAEQGRNSDGRSAVEAIHSLEEPHRSVLTLYYLEELSYREIADALEVPTGTVMSRLSRAKDAIRRILCPAP